MMMTFFTKHSRLMLSYGLLVVGILTFQSCSKQDNTPVTIPAFLSVVNTSPTLSTYNFYLNDGRVNGQAALPFGGGIAYFNVNPGDYNAKFTTATSTESVITKKISVATNQAYTLYLIGKGANLDYLITTDDLSKTSNKAFIRFVNLSPDAPALNLAVKGGADLITGQAYKESSKFIEVDAKAYELDIKADGQATPLGNIASTTFVAGVYYTVLASGLITHGTGDQAFIGKVIPITTK